MASSKLADLTTVATVTGDEYVYVVDDPGGTPLDRKVTVDSLLARGTITDVVKRVRVATTVAGTLASSFENGDTVDGVVLATGDRILLKNQATGADNGIYVVAASGAPARAADFDSSAEALPNTMVVVAEGTTNADTVWQLTTNAAITLGSTALVFAQFGAGSGASLPASAVSNVATSQTTSSASFTGLATASSVSVVTGTKALVIVGAFLTNDTAGNTAYMGFAVSGATTLAAAAARSLSVNPITANYGTQAAMAFEVTGLTAGTNVFTTQFMTGGGTMTAANRFITVIDMGS